MIWYQPMLERLRQLHHGPPYEIRLWSGERFRVGPPDGPALFALHFKTRTSLIRSLLQSSLGMGESYARGDITVEGDLEDALTTLGETYLALSPPGPIQRFVKKLLIRSLPQEKADIEHHYGLGDSFYELYLDKRLQ